MQHNMERSESLTRRIHSSWCGILAVTVAMACLLPLHLALASPMRTLANRDSVRAVPNPWSRNRAIALTDRGRNTINATENRIAFFHVKPQSLIRIYTVEGNLVRTVDLREVPDNLLFRKSVWDLRSDDGQYVVSGIYVYVITSPTTTDIGKLVILR